MSSQTKIYYNKANQQYFPSEFDSTQEFLELHYIFVSPIRLKNEDLVFVVRDKEKNIINIYEVNDEAYFNTISDMLHEQYGGDEFYKKFHVYTTNIALVEGFLMCF